MKYTVTIELKYTIILYIMKGKELQYTNNEINQSKLQDKTRKLHSVDSLPFWHHLNLRMGKHLAISLILYFFFLLKFCPLDQTLFVSQKIIEAKIFLLLVVYNALERFGV